MKYSKGDEVTVGRFNSHELKAGTLMTITKVYSGQYPHYIAELSDGIRYWMNDNDLE